jgi:hypothetical protein
VSRFRHFSHEKYLSSSIVLDEENKWVIAAKFFFHRFAGVDFINILQAAFARADPKIAKNIDCFNAFFALMGSAHMKALPETLMKLTPDRHCRSGSTCFGPFFSHRNKGFLNMKQIIKKIYLKTFFSFLKLI